MSDTEARDVLVDAFNGALSRYGLLAGDERLHPTVADTLVAVVEAVGWGPPVEPITELERGALWAVARRVVVERDGSFYEMALADSRANALAENMLAALPERHRRIVLGVSGE